MREWAAIPSEYWRCCFGGPSWERVRRREGAAGPSESLLEEEDEEEEEEEEEDESVCACWKANVSGKGTVELMSHHTPHPPTHPHLLPAHYSSETCASSSVAG